MGSLSFLLLVRTWSWEVGSVKCEGGGKILLYLPF